ncbi:MAG: TIGR01212 family radical SAM protein [Candidatus Delongbacteria bacterium]|nr:TIGR01212 family radical SAM protein [Candidatus Delongbacteria bacterium]
MKERYGKKLGKIGLTLHIPCPNDPPCIFCNKDSFIPQTIKGAVTVREQMEQGLPYVKRKYPTDEFVAYFQDNTSTYGDIEYLERSFKEALSYPEIRVLALSTRPDSIYPELLEMLNRTAGGRDVWLELGLQSVHDVTLKTIGRGHDYACFLNAFKMIREKTDFLEGVHLIIGLPGETDEMVFETFREINRIKPDYIKIHHLQVIKGTGLERIYKSGSYEPLKINKYIELFSKAVSYLDRSIVIHRNLSRAHADQLIAPKWGITAEEFKEKIHDYMDKTGLYQGSSL